MDKKEVLSKLESYAYNRARMDELQEKIDSITYKMTPTYGNLAAAGGGFNSKVEEMGNRRHMLELRKSKYEKKVMEVRRMIEQSGLDKRERGVMWWIANNGKLQAYARREHIGKNNVYKIRDRAVNKIIAAHNSQNVV